MAGSEASGKTEPPEGTGERPWSRSIGRWARRGGGLAVLVLGLTPLFRLAGAGPGGEATVGAASGRLHVAWIGIGAAALVAGAAALWGPGLPPAVAGRLRAVRRRLATGSGAGWIAGLAVGGAALAAVVALAVFRGGPALLDTAVQLVHARFVEAGRPAGPALDRPAFRALQFMLETGRGWVSQYPPGQIALMAGGLALGAPWIVGVAAHGLTTWWTWRAGELAFGDRGRAALAAGGVAVSPFLLTLAGANLSHAPAAAAAAGAAYLALRSTRDGWPWAAAAGTAAGLLFTVRPYSGVILGGALVLAGLTLVPPAGAGKGRSGSEHPPGLAEGSLARLAAAAAGAAPWVLLVGLYNAHFFGHPLRFGYLAAAGPSAGIGFHVDPWGVAYGPLRALGLTSADLTALGVDLLRTPVPATLLAGGYLVVARGLDAGERMAALWALLPLAANALYWHHDLALGPRMLGESGPGWAMLLAASAVGLWKRLPETLDLPGTPRPRGGAAWAGGLVLAAALLYFGPVWIASHRDRADPDPPPSVASADSSVVFVHESWRDRLGARLSARGIRMDSVRTLLRTHGPCRIEGMLVLAREPGTARDSLLARCRRQARADRLGSLGLATFLWRGDLPGAGSPGPTYVRDLGPRRNRELLRRLEPRRPAAVLLPGREGKKVRALPYEAAMDSLWGRR